MNTSSLQRPVETVSNDDIQVMIAFHRNEPRPLEEDVVITLNPSGFWKLKKLLEFLEIQLDAEASYMQVPYEEEQE